MSTTLDSGLDLRGLYPGSRGQVAALLSAMAGEREGLGPAALFTIAAAFLEREFIPVDELDRLSDANLSLVSLAIQDKAPEILNDWHAILLELVGP